ncbi:hypothetical protein [Lysobacter gummosus]
MKWRTGSCFDVFSVGHWGLRTIVFMARVSIGQRGGLSARSFN